MPISRPTISRHSSGRAGERAGRGRLWHILGAWLLLQPVLAGAGQGGGDRVLEQSVCGLQEPFMFWLWNGMAGSPDPARLDGLARVEDIAFRTRDQRTLRGYRQRAAAGGAGTTPPRGYLLVIQGNAILADRILGAFTPFSSAGFDVYVYDFRGYGRSGGKRRLRAIVSDYSEILAALEASDYERGLVYAMSFGGIVLLDGQGVRTGPDRVIIDSAPSRLSGYGCPGEYDPVNHLPGDCSRFLFIVGRQDAVVPPDLSRELVQAAGRCGAQLLEDEAFGHPFMDRDPVVHRRRLQAIRDFLLR